MRVYVGGRGLGVDYDPGLTRAGELSDWETAELIRRVAQSSGYDPGLTRAGELSDAETAELIRRTAAAPASASPFDFFGSMDSSTKWLVGAGVGLVAWAVFIRK